MAVIIIIEIHGGGNIFLHHRHAGVFLQPVLKLIDITRRLRPHHIEGFFNKRLSSNLEPVELLKQLEREVVKRKAELKGEFIVPNDYTLFLNAEDYQRLCAKRVQDALYEAVEKQVIRQNCFMDGELRVRLQKSRTVDLGICEVQSCFTENAVEQEEEEPHTLVLERKKFQVPLDLPQEYKIVSLTVLEGPDVDAFLEFGEKQIYIGRRDKNDFILTDEKASRLHAYIAYERHRHVLHDAGSLNGTFLNGKRIEAACLKSGDEIRVGNTLLLYEVI